MVRPHPLSFFARQHLLVKSSFVGRYPHPWLLWQATEEQATQAGAHDTWVPTNGPPPTTRADTLCYELTGEERFRIGSVAGNEVVIYEPSVLAEHCALTKDSSGWHVSVGADVSTLTLSGNPVATGIAVPLTSGDVLAVGEVKVMFLSSEAFAQRVAEAAVRL